MARWPEAPDYMSIAEDLIGDKDFKERMLLAFDHARREKQEPGLRQVAKDVGYKFVPKGTLDSGMIHGLIYKGTHGKAIGEWTATVYELTDGISIQDLISNPRKDVPNMRGLFQVFVVDPDDESIVVRTEVIAKSYDGAKLRVLKDTELARDVEDYDVIAIRIGDLRAKKEVQEVKIVGG